MRLKSSDQILVAETDELCQRKIDQEDSCVNIRAIIQKFGQNKISVERLQPLVSKIAKREDVALVTAKMEKDGMQRRNWLKLLGYASELLSCNQICHVVIKFLRYPYVLMSDLDILTLNPTEEIKALDLLNRNGFDLLQFRLLAHPMKIMARKPSNEFNVQPDLDLDFYPEPMWIRKKVADNNIIFSRRIIFRTGPLRVFVPSPEDDFYLVGTHAYAHLTITLAEILHGLKIVSENSGFDWDYLYYMARNYGCLDSIYLYLRVLDLYSQTFRLDSELDNDVMCRYERTGICKKLGSWFERTYSDTIEFPIHVPITIGCIRSSFYHCGELRGRLPLQMLLNDFMTHYLVLSSKAVLGKT